MARQLIMLHHQLLLFDLFNFIYKANMQQKFNLGKFF